jgi:hypothetical protein
MTALSGWANFYVIVGSSAGALIGLQFVVMALVADMPRSPNQAQAGQAFATPTIVSLRNRAAAIRGSERSMAERGRGRTFLGSRGSRRTWVRHRGGTARSTNRISAGTRGLAVSCGAACRGLRDPLAPACALVHPRWVPVWRRNRGAAVLFISIHNARTTVTYHIFVNRSSEAERLAE